MGQCELSKGSNATAQLWSRFHLKMFRQTLEGSGYKMGGRWEWICGIVCETLRYSPNRKVVNRFNWVSSWLIVGEHQRESGALSFLWIKIALLKFNCTVTSKNEIAYGRVRSHWSYPSGDWGGWLFKQIPEKLLIFGASGVTKVFFVPGLQRFSFFSHLLVNMLFALMILVLTTRLQVQFVDSPKV